jgi:hypothetical protein
VLVAPRHQVPSAARYPCQNESPECPLMCLFLQTTGTYAEEIDLQETQLQKCPLGHQECDKPAPVKAMKCLLARTHSASLAIFSASTAGSSKYSAVSFLGRAVSAMVVVCEGILKVCCGTGQMENLLMLWFLPQTSWLSSCKFLASSWNVLLTVAHGRAPQNSRPFWDKCVR